MTGYLIYNKYESKRNEWFINELINEFNKKGINLILLIEENLQLLIDSKPNILYNSQSLEIATFVINRTNNYLIAKQFENLGVRVFNNSKVTRIANNKYLSYLYVSQCGLPTMNTKLCSKIDNSYVFNYPVIVKSLDGKGGKDVYLCNDNNDFIESIGKIESKYYIVQKVANDIGKDLRVYILDNKIYKSMIRVSHKSFKSNYCLGNDAYIYELNNEEIEIVNKINNLFHFDYVGIDFIFNDGKIVFNEIEDAVGSRMLYDKTDLNVASDYASYICNEIEK